MVKGISKQVIVVNSQDKKLFEQAIFILSDDAIRGKGVTDEMLLKEAKMLINSQRRKPKTRRFIHPLFFSAVGAFATGLIWLLTSIL